MKRALATAAVLLLAGMPVFAHRLDEYLQGTLISIEKNRVSVQITLTPGVAVFPALLAGIDLDSDGMISAVEQRAYAGKVLNDLSISIDGRRLTPRLLSVEFAAIDAMKEGRGEIQIEFDSELPVGAPNRKLIFENHHQSQIAAYQVNCLVPHDPEIQIVAQKRDYSQSFYELDFVQGGVPSIALNSTALSGAIPVRAMALLLVAGLALVWLRHDRRS